METISDFLHRKSILIKKQNGKEIIIDCLFSDCDEDSRTNEAHMYINSESGAFQCKKCGAKGGRRELLAILGEHQSSQQAERNSPYDYKRYEQNIPEHVLQYLGESRHLTLETILKNHLGYGNFYKQQLVTIPFFDENKQFTSMFKLRTLRHDSTSKYLFYPTGCSASLYGLHNLNKESESIVVCEGEFDCMVLQQEGFNAVTSSAGATTFKDEWNIYLEPYKEIIILFDNDEVGTKSAEELSKKLSLIFPNKKISISSIPLSEGIKDVSDYYGAGGNLNEVINHTKVIQDEPRSYEHISMQELADTLSLTIKEDNTNKVITFLCFLTMYTNDSQFNIMFNAPSSTGKSFIPLEIAKLFPKEDIIDIAYSSPTAFYHEMGDYDPSTNVNRIDLSTKTVIFLDQPNSSLLSNLRPILSHDQKEITIKITDKLLKGGMKTKTIVIKGFPSVIFCTTNNWIDEQEQTRVILLSPEMSQSKLTQSVESKIIAETDKDHYLEVIKSDTNRNNLKNRILAIKYSGIKKVNINNTKLIHDLFFQSKKNLQPRDQRDISKIMQIISGLSLLNHWQRVHISKDTIEASTEDIKTAFELWSQVSIAQSAGISPYILNFLKEIIYDSDQLIAHDALNTEVRLEKEQIIKKYYSVYERTIDNKSIVSKYLKPLIYAGILEEKESDRDRRTKDYLLTEYGINILRTGVGIPKQETTNLQADIEDVL